MSEPRAEYAPHLCEACGEREHDTLSTDSHPKGVNLLICQECVYDG